MMIGTVTQSLPAGSGLNSPAFLGRQCATVPSNHVAGDISETMEATVFHQALGLTFAETG